MSPVGSILLWLFTWPYNRTLRHYTILPIADIAAAANDQGREKVNELVKDWIQAKRHELDFVQVASTVAAAGTIGIFSWPSVSSTLWIAQALWYISLLLSIWAIIMSAQQTTLLESLSSTTNSDRDVDNTLKALLRKKRTEEKRGMDWNMVYVHQNPMMLMSYSWALFILALLLHIIAPLIRRDVWGDGTKIAVFYLVVGGLTFLNFVWCSYWLYNTAEGPWGEAEEETPGQQTQGNEPADGTTTRGSHVPGSHSNV